MAKRNTVKAESESHERFIARWFDGERSASSGASPNHPGDVRTTDALIECKTTGGIGRSVSSGRVDVHVFEKIADEAWSVGLRPELALRIFNPESILANDAGYVDFIVRLVKEDVA